MALAVALAITTIGATNLTAEAKTFVCTTEEHTHTAKPDRFPQVDSIEKLNRTISMIANGEYTQGCWQLQLNYSSVTIDEVKTPDIVVPALIIGGVELTPSYTIPGTVTPAYTIPDLTTVRLEWVLICGKEEHTHSDACYINKELNAGLYVTKYGIDYRETELKNGTEYLPFPSNDFIKVGTTKFTQMYPDNWKTFRGGDGYGEIYSVIKTVPTGVYTYSDAGYLYSLDFSTVKWYVIKTYNLKFMNIDGHGDWIREAIPYNLTFELNGGYFNTDVPATYTIEDTLTFVAPEREGYLFEGWFTDPEFTTAATGIAAGTTGDMTFYAKWSEAIVYTITYIPNGGTVDSGARTTYTVLDEVTLPGATRSLYGFMGWIPQTEMSIPDEKPEYRSLAASTSSTGTYLSVIPRGTTGDIVVMADWEQCQMLVVKFVDGFGNTLSTQNIPSGWAAAAPTTPVVAGYTFTGWNTAFDYISSDLVVTALWEAIPAPEPTPEPEPTPAPTPVPVPEEEEVVVIEEEEETPLAETPEEVVEEETPAPEQEVVEIEEEETPLAVLESDCIIHWIILLITALYAVYGVARAVARNKKIRQLQGANDQVNA